MGPLAYLGFVKKTHGFKGAVKIVVENPNLKFKETEPLMLEINKKPVPFFIEQILKTKAEWQVKFEDIRSVEEAEEITGLSVFIESEQDSDDEIWVNDATGYQISDIHLGNIGHVKQHITKPGQDLLEIAFNDKTFFIPFVEEIITGYDTKKQILYTDLPEGLMNINE